MNISPYKLPPPPMQMSLKWLLLPSFSEVPSALAGYVYKIADISSNISTDHCYRHVSNTVFGRCKDFTKLSLKQIPKSFLIPTLQFFSEAAVNKKFVISLFNAKHFRADKHGNVFFWDMLTFLIEKLRTFSPFLKFSILPSTEFFFKKEVSKIFLIRPGTLFSLSLFCY